MEVINTVVTLEDAADDYVSALTNLTKTGFVLWADCAPATSHAGSQTNIQTIGQWTLLDGGFGQIVFGERISSFRLTVHKVAGTSGNINNTYRCLFIMRGHAA